MNDELPRIKALLPLQTQVDSRALLAPGSDEELEIRACTVQAVELLRARLQRRLEAEGASATTVSSVTLDWWLWTEGERDKHLQRPHHQTLTPFY